MVNYDVRIFSADGDGANKTAVLNLYSIKNGRFVCILII